LNNILEQTHCEDMPIFIQLNKDEEQKKLTLNFSRYTLREVVELDDQRLRKLVGEELNNQAPEINFTDNEIDEVTENFKNEINNAKVMAGHLVVQRMFRDDLNNVLRQTHCKDITLFVQPNKDKKQETLKFNFSRFTLRQVADLDDQKLGKLVRMVLDNQAPEIDFSDNDIRTCTAGFKASIENAVRYAIELVDQQISQNQRHFLEIEALGQRGSTFIEEDNLSEYAAGVEVVEEVEEVEETEEIRL